MNDKDRIRLAEWMGWTWSTWRDKWLTPDKKTITELPDPFTDANDCEALIIHLGSLGLGVDIYRRPWMKSESVIVYFQGEPVGWKEQRWQGNDWKQGVCELALKILPVEDSDAG